MTRSIWAGKKSYAVTFGLQDSEQTLSDKVIEKTMDKIYQTLNKEAWSYIKVKYIRG